MEQGIPHRNQDISLPHNYWTVISQEDKAEFIKLRQNFLHDQKLSSKDRRIVTFRKELNSVLNYIERSHIHVEERSVLVGVCFAGPFICVNTRQLKNFLGRCKSSINGSFQQMGYVALRTKAKARSCVVTVMPSLQNEQNILRQWTVRCASEDAHFCFLSSFSHIQLPQITDDDLYDDKRPSQHPIHHTPTPYQNLSRPFSTVQISHQYTQYKAPTTYKTITADLDIPDSPSPINTEPSYMRSYDMPMSTSMDFNIGSSDWNYPMSSYDNDYGSSDWDHQKSMTRSNSAYLYNPSKEWDLFDNP